MIWTSFAKRWFHRTCWRSFVFIFFTLRCLLTNRSINSIEFQLEQTRWNKNLWKLIVEYLSSDFIAVHRNTKLLVINNYKCFSHYNFVESKEIERKRERNIPKANNKWTTCTTALFSHKSLWIMGLSDFYVILNYMLCTSTARLDLQTTTTNDREMVTLNKIFIVLQPCTWPFKRNHI